ncbi:hypothetical protein TI39_contig347g00019 [Zymoseptoria brevis]|uniref:Uncharacterized protein n=1 Tax=Zymoseptoria brevis TaxID=1047168 RepID=A0A0F4GR84_9PEZI|nr:hypothetical protein TI39_contig347g00019 [Zymoseptoria brevis]
MVRKRPAEDSADGTITTSTEDLYSNNDTTSTSSTTLSERPTKRLRHSLAIDDLFNSSSSLYISSSTSNSNSPTDPPTPIWTAANKISQPLSKLLPLRQRSWYASIFSPSPTSPSLPILDSTQPAYDRHPIPSETCSSGGETQGIATYILPSGQPIPLPRSYTTSALLAAKSCRGGISEIVYDASFADEESGWRLDNGYSSTGTVNTEYQKRDDGNEAEEVYGHRPVRLDGGRMSASEKVFATYGLVERILFKGGEGGEVVRRMGGVSRAFRHVVKRSVGVRRRVDGSSWL